MQKIEFVKVLRSRTLKLNSEPNACYLELKFEPKLELESTLKS